jgi:hypothetical protein
MLRRSLVTAVAVCLIAASAGSARANLITNGNFATGDFTGWTVSGNGIGIDPFFPNTGDTYDAYFSAGTTDQNSRVLSQSIATIAGASYNLSFALFNEGGLSGDSFTVSFGGFSDTITGDQASPFFDGINLYTSEAFAIPGGFITDPSTVLSFEGLNAVGADWHLDDVSLTPAANVPGPIVGAGLPGMIFSGLILLLWLRRHRSEQGERLSARPVAYSP